MVDPRVRLAAVSDLHIATGGPEDDFREHAERFCTMVDHLTGPLGVPPETVHYLGDVLELAGTPVGTSADEILTHYPEVARRIRPGVHLWGNHDPRSPLARLEAIDVSGIHMEHGHRGDHWHTGRWAWVGRLACRAGGWLERIGLTDIDRTPAQVDDAAYRREFAARYDQYFTDYLRRHPRVGLVLFGHTHRPGLHRTTIDGLDRVICNVGDFVGHCTAAVVAGGVVRLLQHIPF